MVSSPQPGHERARLVALPSPTLAQADDATLARAASSGDPRATSVLWDRFSPLVRRILRRTLGPQSEVEPLLQRVFVRAVDELGNLPESAQLRPLVIALTVRVLRSELKRRRLRRLLRLRSARRSESGVAAGSALVALYDILDQLDVDARLAFTLRHFEGLPIVEIASATDASLASTRRRLSRAGGRVHAAVQRSAVLRASVGGASVLGDGP